MKNRWLPTDKLDSVLNDHFEKARKSKPPIDSSIAREALESRIQSGKHVNARGLYLRRSVGIAAVVALFLVARMILVNSTLPSDNRSGLEVDLSGNFYPSEEEWSIEKASYTKDYFLGKLISDTVDVNAPVKVLIYQQGKNTITDLSTIEIQDDSGKLSNSVKVYPRTKLVSSLPTHIPILKVSDEILENLGFELGPKEVNYEANVKHYGYLRFTVNQGRQSVFVSDEHMEDTDRLVTYYPLYISNMKGEQRLRFRFDKEDEDKMSQDYFNRILDDLVPIAIPNPQKESEYMAIFWFKSSEELFDDLIEEPIPSAPSESFTTSKDIADGVLENPKVTVGQNPFYRSLEVTYTLQKPAKARMDLMSIDGRLTRNLIPQKSHEASVYEESFDLQGLPKGIYLLVLTTDSERISHRIIKQ